ncbi:MAG: glycerophosphodiester phosphodiesterase [Candidatus Magnetomorum sp.]|nr:glycerophosphodiester phosphodiesterase [Candidatus Magnetomorum sp.]
MVKNIAHRGARIIAPENTLYAAEQALLSGADMWELDIQYTADKEIIVLHDDTLERTSNVHLFQSFESKKPWRVVDFTRDEISVLDFGHSFQPSSHQTISIEKYDAPFLEEAVRFSKENSIDMNIEIKDLAGCPGHDTIAAHAYSVVKDLNFLDHVLFSSFHHEYLFQIKHIDPHARIAVLMDSPSDNLFSLLERLNAEAYHPYYKMIDPFQIEQLHHKGFQVNVWTVNDPHMMKSFINMNVDGIVTDDPALLSLLLSEG